MKSKIQHALWKIGIDVTRITSVYHPWARRRRIFEINNIDTVLDVGANTGQFAHRLRKHMGYRGKIISFEPLNSAFNALEKHARNDPRWDVYRFALGDIEEKREMNIANNSVSSSFLDMLPSHLSAAPASRYTDREEVEIKKIDSIFDSLPIKDATIYMKVDTQGFDGNVIRGAERSLPRIPFIQIEMSLTPLYEGEIPFIDMCLFMQQKGYSLIGLETGLTDPASGHLLQMDGIFRRI